MDLSSHGVIDDLIFINKPRIAKLTNDDSGSLSRTIGSHSGYTTSLKTKKS